MVEVLITFERPPSMSRAEMCAWISERARTGPPAITLGTTDGADGDPQVLRVEVDGHWTEAVDDQLADLMMDMRLLGLRPTIMPAPGSREGDGRTA